MTSVLIFVGLIVTLMVHHGIERAINPLHRSSHERVAHSLILSVMFIIIYSVLFHYLDKHGVDFIAAFSALALFFVFDIFSFRAVGDQGVKAPWLCVKYCKTVNLLFTAPYIYFYAYRYYRINHNNGIFWMGEKKVEAALTHYEILAGHLGYPPRAIHKCDLFNYWDNFIKIYSSAAIPSHLNNFVFKCSGKVSAIKSFVKQQDKIDILNKGR